MNHPLRQFSSLSKLWSTGLLVVVLASIVAWVLTPTMLLAQLVDSVEQSRDAEAEPLKLSVETIYGQKEFAAKTISAKWSEQRPQCYLEWRDANDGGQNLVEINAVTKAEQLLVSAASLTPPGQSKPLSVSGYQWSATGAKLLIYTNTKRVWRRNTRGDYWGIGT